ncbi:MAG: DMT family transporter [Paracoccaceae bacterium]
MFTPQDQNRPLAIGLMLCAAACIAVTTLLAKGLGTGRLGDWDLGPPLPALQISHGRFLFAFIAIATVSMVLRLRPRAIHWRLHIARTSLGWAGVTLMFASVAFIPMADATAISFLNPVFCMIFAIPLLGEKVGPVRWGAAAIALLGALILLRPTADAFQPAALLALSAALIMGLEIILIKKLSGREPPLQILAINNAIGVCIASLAVMWVWQAPTPAQWIALATIGGAMATAQACFVNAMARAEASFITPFSYATLIFAATYDGFLYQIRPDGTTILGCGVILIGAALLAWREARLKSHT